MVKVVAVDVVVAVAGSYSTMSASTTAPMVGHEIAHSSRRGGAVT